MFAHSFGCILSGQRAFKVSGILLELLAQWCLVLFKLSQGLNIGLQGGMCSIGAHGYPDTLLLQQVIHFDLHQHVVPEARACHPVGGECLLGATFQGHECVFRQRGAKLSQPSSSLPLVTLAAELFVGSCFCLTLGLFRLSTPFPHRQSLREEILRSPECLDGEVHRFRGLQGMAHDEGGTLRPVGRQVVLGQGHLLWCRVIGKVARAGEPGIEVEHELAGISPSAKS